MPTGATCVLEVAVVQARQLDRAARAIDFEGNAEVIVSIVDRLAEQSPSQ